MEPAEAKIRDIYVKETYVSIVTEAYGLYAFRLIELSADFWTKHKPPFKVGDKVKITIEKVREDVRTV